jgi:hypothetical protein
MMRFFRQALQSMVGVGSSCISTWSVKIWLNLKMVRINLRMVNINDILLGLVLLKELEIALSMDDGELMTKQC